MQFSIISRYRTEFMGIAIVNVMIAHILSWMQLDVDSSIAIKLLSTFCRLLFTEGFLFISGFGLYYSFTKGSNIKSFFNKRINRLLLPFIVISFPFYCYSDIIQSAKPLTFFLDISSLYFWFYGNNDMWYISMSVLLYALFPLFYNYIFAHNGKEFARTIFLISISYACSIIIYFYFSDYYKLINIGLDKIPIFILGIYVGYLSYNKKKINLLYVIATLIPLLAISSILKSRYEFMISFNEIIVRLFGLLVLCFIAIKSENNGAKNKIWGIFSWLGTYSLELYILHMLLYSSIVKGMNLPPIVAVLLALALCVPTNYIAKNISSQINRFFITLPLILRRI